jgi:hypothetical protein
MAYVFRRPWTYKRKHIAAAIMPLVHIGSLVSTEAADTAAFNATANTSGSLISTEALDTAAFNATAVSSGSLVTTEGADTASFAGTNL